MALAIDLIRRYHLFRGRKPLTCNYVVRVEVSQSAMASVGPEPTKKDVRDAILAGPILPQMLALSAPTMVVLLTQTAFLFIEAYFIGMLGTDALAGLALVFPFWMLMLMISNGGIGSGVAGAIARAAGARRQNDVDALTSHTLVIAIGFGFLCWGVMHFFGETFFRALGGTGGALEAALDYSSFLFASSVAIWIVNLLACAFRGRGNVMVSAAVILSGTIVLVPTTAVLMFGWGPFPAMGIQGAGLAINVYYTFGAMILIWLTIRGSQGVSFGRFDFRWTHFRDILGVGLMATAVTAQTNLLVIFLTGTAGLLGTQALAGYGIAARIDYFMTPVLFAWGSGVLTMVAINIGAGQTARAKAVGWTGVIAAAVFFKIVGVAIAVFPDPYVDALTDDRVVAAFSVSYLQIVAPAYALLALGFIAFYVAQGTGNVMPLFLAGTARMVIAAGGGYLLVAHYGLGMQAIAGMVFAGLVAYGAISAFALLRRSTWKALPARP